MARRWTIPSFSAVIADLLFLSSQDKQSFLCVLLVDGRLFFYQIEQMQLVGEFDLRVFEEQASVSASASSGGRRASTVQRREISAYSGLFLLEEGSEETDSDRRKELLLGCHSPMHCVFLAVSLPSSASSSSGLTKKSSKKRKAEANPAPGEESLQLRCLSQSDRYRNVLAMQSSGDDALVSKSPLLCLLGTH